MRRRVKYDTPRDRKLNALSRKIYELDMEIERYTGNDLSIDLINEKNILEKELQKTISTPKQNKNDFTSRFL